MSQCATAPCSVSAARHPVHVRGIGRQLVGVDEAEVVVAVRNLRCATGIDDVDLRGDLVARAEPGLARPGRARRWRSSRRTPAGSCSASFCAAFQIRSLAPGLPKWSPAAAPVGALRVDQLVERVAGRDRPRRRRTRPSNTTTPGPSVSARISSACRARRSGFGERGRRVDEDTRAHVVGMRVVGEIGVLLKGGDERLEAAVGLLDPGAGRLL